MTDWRQAGAVKGLFVDGASDAHSATATMPPPSRNGEAPFAQWRWSGSNAATSNGAPNRAAYDFREHVSSVLTDLCSLDFWEEIVPIDATNVRRMLTDPVILAVFVGWASGHFCS